MRLHLVKRALPAIFIAATWWTGACSSDQQETEEPINNAQENQENSNQGEAEGGNASENAIAGSAEAEGNSNSTAADASTADASAAAEPPPSPEPAPPPVPEAPAPTATPTTMAATPPAGTSGAAGDDIAPQPNRFVRYVQVASAVVRSEPNDGAATVVTLAKGDHILVSEENGWGKIASGKFIKLSELSHKAVPRDRIAAAWN
jgi:hypothetical protein